MVDLSVICTLYLTWSNNVLRHGWYYELLGSHLALRVSVSCPGYVNPNFRLETTKWRLNRIHNTYALPREWRPRAGMSLIFLLSPFAKFLLLRTLIIFDYESIKEGLMPPFDHVEITAIPRYLGRAYYKMDMRDSSVLPPFFCSSSIRFSSGGCDHLCGVILNYPYENDPTVDLAQAVKSIKFLRIPWSEEHPIYGHHKAAIITASALT